MASFQRLLLESAGTQYIRVRSNSSLSHSGTFDLTVKVRFLSQSAGGAAQLYECPNLWWCANDTLADTVGYRLELMTDGYQLFKNGTFIDDNWADGLPLSTSEVTIRILEVAGGWSLYRNGVLLKTLADTTRLTSGYFGFSVLNGVATIDDISGTFTQDFESATLGSVTINTTFATNMYSLGGGNVEIESTGNRLLTVTPATCNASGKNVGMLYNRRLAVSTAEVQATPKPVGMRYNRLLSVTKASVNAQGNNLGLYMNRILKVTPSSMVLRVIPLDVTFTEKSDGGMILFRQKGRR